ncbi:MAG: hypothetical protein M3256_12710 [Actinomycetota bacterium]|nr:hypothetical protein [Actinomycetota bacterium]
MPPFDLGAGRTLGSLQRVDLIGEDWDEGASRLVASVLRILDRDVGAASKVQALATPGNEQFATRGELTALIGSIDDRLDAIRDSACISGNDMALVVGSKAHRIEALLAEGRRFQIMCADPKTGSAPTTLAQIDPQFEDPEAFIKAMESTDHRLRVLRNRHPEQFEFRYLPFAPSVGFFITDPHQADGVIKLELYVAKPFLPGGSRPHVVISEQSQWREFWLKQWENYWALGQVQS